MTISLRMTLLAGLAATLALPAAAQDLAPKSVLEEDAVEVTSVPVVQELTLPPMPNYPAVMQWPLAHARKLLDVAEGIAAEGLKPPTTSPTRCAQRSKPGPDRNLTKSPAARSPGWPRTCATGARRWKRAGSGSWSIPTPT